MLYSKTAKYAVLALAEIARRSTERAVATKTIAEAASIPYPHLAKILIHLKRADLVISLRGKRGGIKLARPANEITIRDVVVALDGAGMLADCPLLLEPCTCERECSLHPIWKPARDAVVRFLEATSIADVADACAQLDSS